MKKYNLFVLMPNLTDSEIEAIKKNVQELVAKSGGQVIKIDDCGKRKLSYIIKKIRQGFYVNFVIEIESEKIAELNNNLKRQEGSLRFEISNHKEGEKKISFDEEDERKEKGGRGKGITQDELKKESDKTKLVEESKEKEEKKDEPKEKVDMDQLNEKIDNILEVKDI